MTLTYRGVLHAKLGRSSRVICLPLFLLGTLRPVFVFLSWSM